MTKRKLFSLVSPALCTLLGSLVLFTSLDAKFADLYQKALPGTEVRDDVILVGIDDYAIDVVGSFPFTRDVYADCINVMEEFNASSVVFDLTFLDFSRPSVNENYEPFEPDEVMEASLENSSIDYLSFTFDNSNTPSEYEKEIFVERGLLNNYAEISVINDSSTQEYTGVMPAIPNFLEHAAGAGYVNADPDSDNYYRRVNPVIKYEGGYYGQLTLPALLKKLGNPKIIIDERIVTLKDAHCSGEVKDIVIPRGNDGKVILRYPKMLFDDYNYISIGKIYHVAQLRRWMEEDGEDEYIEEYELLCGQLKEALSDSLCIIGTCASSTSDYGVNLYEAQYPLPGVHYSFANQILNEDFISEIPWYCSVLYAFAVSVLIVFVMNRVNRTGIKIFSGLIMILLSSAVLFAVFWFKRIYSGQAVPLITPFLTYISTVAMGFLAASKDRKFITNAFSQCLSKDVVDQIVANPDSFKLGGESLQMTAIFTDIQKFSSFSELLTAAQLVALLNYYLTKMSDIIMSEGGTIDKYEGDAIIALVGAPLKMDDHAERAVKAALKMKAAEKIMNAEIRKISKEPKPDSMDDNLYSAFKIMVDNN
ncbi:MAG: adenylate/guanylate cyclase domain-containing protein, partial [Treponema sp.]|nr:adenylate/guanylate cyclase domain-containing protein [Treponema sp.]